MTWGNLLAAEFAHRRSIDKKISWLTQNIRALAHSRGRSRSGVHNLRRAIAFFSAISALATGAPHARAETGGAPAGATNTERATSAANEGPATNAPAAHGATNAPANGAPSAPANGAPSAPITLLPSAVEGAPLAIPGRARRTRVAWDPAWPRFRWWEYVGTGAVYLADWYVRYHMPPPDHAAWEGQNFFDDTIRGWLRSGSQSGRHTAVRFSDYVSWAGTAYPFVVDLPVVWFVHGQPGVMWQMLMMNLEANAVAGLFNNLLFHYTGRGRPNTPDCDADSSYDPLCGGIGNNASFPSGHTLTIATAAGLVCVHHRYLPIYGADWADNGACILLSAATLATGISRIVADRHFASDVIMGGTIGFSSGYVLPWLLHYRARKPDQPAEPQSGVTLIPLASPDSLGLAVVGFGAGPF
jgi:membrane-associated phospholipid phosphatase